MGPQPPPRSCRRGAPVIFVTAAKTPQPATVDIRTHEVGDELTYIVKVGVIW
jgi:hypothetical protein